MRAREYSKLLSAFADALDASNAASAGRVRSILPAFDRIGSVMDIVAKSQCLVTAPAHLEDDTLAQLADDIDAFSEFFARACRPSFFLDTKDLVKTWRHHGVMSIRSFISSLQDAFRPAGEPYAASGESLVDAFVRRLNETKHDSAQFPRVLAALEQNKELKKADVVEIASRVAFRMAKSTSRGDALLRIKRQHESSELAGAKDRATRGKSAA